MRKRDGSIRFGWIMAWLGLAVLLVASGWRPFGDKASRGQQPVPPEQLTLAWQTRHCRPKEQAGLPEIVLLGGRIADVEILDVLGVRLYVPRPWTTQTQHFYGPSPDGISAGNGGSGTFDPWLGPGSSETCRGQVFLSIPGKRADDPRFTLGLGFRRFSTRSIAGEIEQQKGKYPFAHQIVVLNFFGPENANPEEAALLKIPRVSAQQEQQLGDGWNVVRRDDKRPISRLAFDARARAAGEPIARSVEVLEGWALVFPLDEHVWAKVVIERDVPAARWRSYREKAEQIYRWLQTRPGKRGPLPNSF